MKVRKTDRQTDPCVCLCVCIFIYVCSLDMQLLNLYISQQEAEHVEMARRTKETPMALQGENKAPEMYFINLVRYFESEMMYCRTKIEEVSLCMQAASNPCETPDGGFRIVVALL